MSLTDQQRYEALLNDIREEFPGFRVMLKSDSRLHRAIHYALMAVTFGQMRRYLRGYHTTLGQTIYVTPGWDDKSYSSRYIVLRHEVVHIRQFRRYTWLGMALLYGLLPLPMGLAYFRAQLEKEAYAESIRAGAEVWGTDEVRDGAFRESIIRQFTGPSYGWMWPFRRGLERWYDSIIEELPRA